MEYVQFKNGSPVYYKEQPDLNECIQYQVSKPVNNYLSRT